MNLLPFTNHACELYRPYIPLEIKFCLRVIDLAAVVVVVVVVIIVLVRSELRALLNKKKLNEHGVLTCNNSKPINQ